MAAANEIRILQAVGAFGHFPAVPDSPLLPDALMGLGSPSPATATLFATLNTPSLPRLFATMPLSMVPSPLPFALVGAGPGARSNCIENGDCGRAAFTALEASHLLQQLPISGIPGVSSVEKGHVYYPRHVVLYQRMSRQHAILPSYLMSCACLNGSNHSMHVTLCFTTLTTSCCKASY